MIKIDDVVVAKKKSAIKSCLKVEARAYLLHIIVTKQCWFNNTNPVKSFLHLVHGNHDWSVESREQFDHKLRDAIIQLLYGYHNRFENLQNQNEWIIPPLHI